MRENLMNDTSSNAVISKLLMHSSVRRFKDEPIASEMLTELIRCGQAAATSSFIQAYSVIRVTDPQVRADIAAAAGGQVWIEQAAEFLIYCADLRRVNRACVANGAGELEGYAEHGMAAIVDVALMAQNVLTAAESVGLGGVFIGGIRNDPDVVIRHLNLPRLVFPVFGMCLGWPVRVEPVKPRMATEMILHNDVYHDPADSELAAYDAVMANYYRSRRANAKLSDWGEVTARAVQGKKREHILEALHNQGYFLL